MEIIQEIGSYAGFAAVLGLAVLSALYFSQARDVKRLREWAGRAPERGPTPAPQPQRVVAQPIARPGQPGVPGRPAPAVPRPPGAQPGPLAPKPAQAAAAGAAPPIAKGPAPATPAAASTAGGTDQDEGESQAPSENGDTDVTALETAVHKPADVASDEERDDGSTGDEEAVEPVPAAVDDQDEAPGDEPAEADGDDSPDDDQDDVTSQDTGEWSPEDEHSDLGLTDEHEVAPASPAASVPRPPQPPRPYQRRTGPAVAGRPGRSTILPPYEESRPTAEKASGSSGSRRPILLAVGGLVALAIAVFAVLQLAGGDDSGETSGGIAASTTDSGDDSQSQAPIDRGSVTVAVLNGTTVEGLAATIGDRIAGLGFRPGTVTNSFDQERAESVVLFAPGAEREAIAVSRQLDIPQREPIDPDSQALAGDATVVVVAGADQNQ